MAQMFRKRLVISIILISLSISAQVFAQENQNTPQLLPHVGGNQDAYQELSAAAIGFAKTGEIVILLIPSPLSTNPSALSPSERETILATVESERQKIQDSCEQAAPNATICRVMVAPVLTRSDAFDPDILDIFQADLAEIIILDGDQTVGMAILSGTPIELERIAIPTV